MEYRKRITAIPSARQNPNFVHWENFAASSAGVQKKTGSLLHQYYAKKVNLLTSKIFLQI
jgi:hypothetical protein